MATRLEIAKPDIVKYFNEKMQRVYRQGDIADILEENRGFWRLTQSLTIRGFIKYLIDSTKLTKMAIKFPSRKEIRYLWENSSIYEVVLTLRPDCYFSHYSAMRLHGLTEQFPKMIYVNAEQTPKPSPVGDLVQSRIDLAFQAMPRISNNIAELSDLRICLLNGKNTGCLGVDDFEYNREGKELETTLRVTNIERTLIDIVVRPSYAGGIYEVQKAYNNSLNDISVNELTAMLQKLKYTYPYHQAIGFYLERAGARDSQLDLLRRFPMKFDFYLTHQIKENEYIKDWKLYIPKGF